MTRNAIWPFTWVQQQFPSVLTNFHDIIALKVLYINFMGKLVFVLVFSSHLGIRHLQELFVIFLLEHKSYNDAQLTICHIILIKSGCQLENHLY